jgi:ABC-type multidrug transport system fused ATPase/permease subunit
MIQIMNYKFIYERSQSAGKFEAVLLAASALGVIAGIFVFLYHGWALALVVLLLSLIALALSRLFALVSDLFSSIGRFEEHQRGSLPRRDEPEA